MDDALLGRRLERLGDLPCDGLRFVDLHRTVRDALGERRPVHQLHDQRMDAARVLEAVDLRDVRMIERREQMRSRRKRASRSGSVATPDGRTFSATSRSSLVSRAR
jgi:hypothetical protein